MTPEQLKHLAAIDDWKISYLCNIRPTSALVVYKPFGKPELWVRRNYSRYRKAFLKFLQEYCEFEGDHIPSNWQVDHLQPKHRFKKDHPVHFIRLYLLDRKINASFGAGFEKMFFDQERQKQPNKGQHMDWITFLKAYGISLPSRCVGEERWSTRAWKLACFFGKKGIGDNIILDYVGISMVLNLGFTGYWAPLPICDRYRTEALKHPSIGQFPEILTKL